MSRSLDNIVIMLFPQGLSKISSTSYCKLALASILIALSSACSDQLSFTPSENEKTSNLGISVPQTIISARNIDLDQVEPVVELSDGSRMTMTRINTNQWSGTMNVPANSDISLTIKWTELFDGRSLELATLQKTEGVGASAVTLSVGAAEYVTTMDADNDGASNLAERRANTNPFDPDDTPSDTDPPATPSDVIIPRIQADAAPQINGFGAVYGASDFTLIGEWAAAAQEGTIAGSGLFIDSLMIDKGNINVESNPFHRWAAMHDGTFLYLLVLVDDLSANQSDSDQSVGDDSIEIYVDGNNSKLDTYGEADDRYFTIALQEQNSSTANSSASGTGRIQRGINSAPIPTNIEYAIGLATGPLSVRNPPDRQDVYEVKIELSSVGIVPGTPFGIEIQINDDDDGSERDSKWGWVHPSRNGEDVDNTWRNPSFMGTGILQP